MATIGKSVTGQTLQDIIDDRVTFVGTNLADGSAAAPSLAYSTDNTTGLFHDGVGVSTSVSGVKRVGVYADETTFSEPLRGPDGTASLPAFSFDTANDVGVYYDSGSVSIATAGVKRAKIGSRIETYGRTAVEDTNVEAFMIRKDGDTGDVLVVDSVNNTLTMVGEIYAGAGTASAPAFSFTSDSNSGFYSDGQNVVAISTGGNMKACYDDSGTAVVDGTASNPSYGFISDRDTGMYLSTEGVCAVATAGSTATTFNSSGVSLNAGTTLGTYIEGTWTVALGDGTINFVASTNDGVYTRIGNIVHFSIHVVWTSQNSASGNIGFTLPTAATEGYGIIHALNLPPSGDNPMVEIDSSGARVGYYDGKSSGVFVDYTESDLDAADTLKVHGAYFVT